jgi:hypothetical protein
MRFRFPTLFVIKPRFISWTQPDSVLSELGRKGGSLRALLRIESLQVTCYTDLGGPIR